MGASIFTTSCCSGQAHSVHEAVVLTPICPSQLHSLLFTVFGHRMWEECRLAFAGLPKIQMTGELQQEMLANWVSFTCPKPKHEGLWKYEWKKHGSCSRMDRLTYFQTAMTLRNVYNILEMLNVEGADEFHWRGTDHHMQFQRNASSLSDLRSVHLPR